MPHAIELHIRQLRTAAGLRLEDVATALQVSAGWISKVERGQRELKLQRLLDLAAVLRCAPWDLVTFADFAPSPCHTHYPSYGDNLC